MRKFYYQEVIVILFSEIAKKLLGFVFSFLAETLAETGSGFNEYGFETMVFLLIFLYGCIQCRWTFRSSPICRIVDPFLPLLILNFHFLCLNRSWTFLTFHNTDKKPWRLRRGGGRGKLIFLKIDTGPGTSIIMCACSNILIEVIVCNETMSQLKNLFFEGADPATSERGGSSTQLKAEFWIRIQDFGPFWIRIQGYTINFERKNSKQF